MDWSMTLQILQGAGIGLFTVFLGWAKKQEPDKFDWKGLLLRVPTGIAVGAIAGYKGIPFDEAYAFAASVGVIMLVDNISKMLWRRIFKKKKLENKSEKQEK
ncbi:MAG: hypothetical protein D6813_13890 [Calditrichaeota bacterium]|nr:MAG: hypothetical protein D6813_13890 [Calditrichota bacterium]